MKTGKRLVRRSAAEWQSIIDEQATSGQPVRAFAEARGLNPVTLWSWRARLTGKRAGPSSPAFVEVTGPRTAGRGVAPIEVALPNGIMLTVSDAVDARRFGRLVAELCQPC